MYDVDLFETPRASCGLHAQGRRVVCYLSAGSFEPGGPTRGFPPRSSAGRSTAGRTSAGSTSGGSTCSARCWSAGWTCAAKGFDGVEADNVDAYANRTGFPLTGGDQLRFNRFLAAAAHARGLSIGLKNDLDQAARSSPTSTGRSTSSASNTTSASRRHPLPAGKAVFVAEYELAPRLLRPARAAGMMAMRKRLALDAWREPC